MPAVQAFSLYAALSLIFNFLLQVTALVAVMTLDLRRMIDGRVDLLCCVKLKKVGMSDCSVYAPVISVYSSSVICGL